MCVCVCVCVVSPQTLLQYMVLGAYLFFLLNRLVTNAALVCEG